MILVDSYLKKFIFCLSVACLVGCLPSDKPEVTGFTGRTMGTTYSVKLVSLNGHTIKDIQTKVEADLREVDRQMSTYIQTSEISKFNQLGVGQPFKLSSWFATNLKFALQLAKKTDGFYDPTIGPLINLWGFGSKGKKTEPPTMDQINQARSMVGYHYVKIDQQGEKTLAMKAKAEVKVDLSSIAKGFAVDVVSDRLIEFGLKNHLVEIGGELRAMGKKGRAAWKVAIEKPSPGQRLIQKVLKFENLSLATSGSYRNFFNSGGKTYSHLIDPKTGQSVQNDLVSVSVVAENCMEADALATALMALGQKRAIDYVEKNSIAAYMIMVGDPENRLQTKEYQSPKFAELGLEL